MSLTRSERKAKLQRLAELESFETVDQMFYAAVSDTVCPGICCNPLDMACEYTCEVEPDQDRGWCERPPEPGVPPAPRHAGGFTVMFEGRWASCSSGLLTARMVLVATWE
jgi:hypothetical protein